MEAWETGRQFATADELRGFAVLSAGAYAKAGRHADAARRLDDLAKSDKLSADDRYNVACGYALCSAGAKVEREQAVKYQVLAMESLGKAVKAGFRDAANMRVDTDLDTLRERDDFKKLLADLEKKLPTKPAPADKPPEGHK